MQKMTWIYIITKQTYIWFALKSDTCTGDSLGVGRNVDPLSEKKTQHSIVKLIQHKHIPKLMQFCSHNNDRNLSIYSGLMASKALYMCTQVQAFSLSYSL